MKTTLKQYAKDNNLNVMDAWQTLVRKGVFEKPVYTRLRESDGAIVVDHDYVKKMLDSSTLTTHIQCVNPVTQQLIPEAKVFDKDGFLIAYHVSTTVIPANNDVNVGASYAGSTAMKNAEQAMWEILGHGLRVHILNLENVEIEV